MPSLLGSEMCIRDSNKPLSPDVWRSLKSLVAGQLSGKKLYVIDAWCGASPDTRLGVRFVTEVAWQAHFVKNMFIVPSADELASFTPDFVVLNGAGCTNANWQAQGMNSENFVAFNLSERIQLIGGTWYGGEMKKGMFSVMNLSLIHISEPTRLGMISYAVFCLKKKKGLANN